LQAVVKLDGLPAQIESADGIVWYTTDSSAARRSGAPTHEESDMSDEQEDQGSAPESGATEFDDAASSSAGEEALSGAGAIFGPFFNAILGPADCWRALDARPLLGIWIALWVGVFQTILAFITLPITRQAMIASTRSAMQAQGDVTAEQLRQSAETMSWVADIMAYAGVFFILLMIAIVALTIWLIATVMGGKATFSRSFALASAAAVIKPLLYGVYVTIIFQFNPPEIRRASDIQQMTPTLGLDLLFSGPDTPGWLNALFMRIDLFSLWWMVLIVSGAMVLLKLSKGQGITLGAILWTFGTLFAMLGALFQTG